MDRPFENLFTPKIVLSYTRFLAVLALQPVFELWSRLALLLLDNFPTLAGSGGSKAGGKPKTGKSSSSTTTARYCLIEPDDALFLRRDIDNESNRPTVTVAMTIKLNGIAEKPARDGQVSDLSREQRAEKEIRRRISRFISSTGPSDLRLRLMSVPRKFLGLWFWERLSPSSSSTSSGNVSDVAGTYDELVDERVRLVGDGNDDASSSSHQWDVTLDAPWRVYVDPAPRPSSPSSNDDDGGDVSVRFVAHRCLIDEERVLDIVAALDPGCGKTSEAVDLNSVTQKECAVNRKPPSAEGKPAGPLWRTALNVLKKYYGAATYFASLDLCRESNDFFARTWTSRRLQGRTAIGIPAQVLEDVARLNKVGKADVVHVGIVAAFLHFHERHGKNRGLEFVTSALLNPASLVRSTAVPSEASGVGRFSFPILSGPPQTKMRMIKELVDGYGNDKSCDLVKSLVVNRIPEDVASLDFSWSYGVAHVFLPQNFSLSAGNSLDLVSFMPGGGGGYAFTCLHNPGTETHVFVEGDESLLKSGAEIELMCEDVLAEVKLLRNFTEAANGTDGGRKVAPMRYPPSGVRLQPPPKGDRSAASLVLLAARAASGEDKCLS